MSADKRAASHGLFEKRGEGTGVSHCQMMEEKQSGGFKIRQIYEIPSPLMSRLRSALLFRVSRLP